MSSEEKKSLSRKNWGCVKTKHRSNYCRAMCVPDDGVGACGRIAPHALVGRTKQAMLDHEHAP